MRGIVSEINVMAGIADAWDVVSRLEFCRKLTEAFWTGGRRLDYTAVLPEDTPTRGLAVDLQPLVKGAEVQVRTKRGREWIDWKVTEYDPPRSISYRAAETESWLNSYFAVVRISLRDLGGDRTRITARMTLIFLNRGLEIVSLVLPGRFLYKRGIDRLLYDIQDSLEFEEE